MWQVGPWGMTLTSSVSLSQSVATETMSSRLPLVSPLVQSVRRERL